MTKLGDLIDIIITLFIVSLLVYVSYTVLSVDRGLWRSSMPCL